MPQTEQCPYCNGKTHEYRDSHNNLIVVCLGRLCENVRVLRDTKHWKSNEVYQK